MSQGRSAPSGKLLTVSPALPPPGNPVDGALAIPAPGLAVSSSATLVSFTETNPKGGSYLVASGATVRANATVSTGAFQIQFTPTVGPAVVLNARAYSIGTSNTQFRILPQVVDLDGPGTLALLVANGAADALVIVESQSSIQPIQVNTK